MEKNLEHLSLLLCILCLVLVSGCAHQEYIEPDSPPKQEFEIENLNASEEDTKLSEEQNRTQLEEHNKTQPSQPLSTETSKEPIQTETHKNKLEEAPKENINTQETSNQEQANSQRKNKETQKSDSESLSGETGSSDEQSALSKKHKREISEARDSNTDNALTERYTVQGDRFPENLPTPLNANDEFEGTVTAKTEKEIDAGAGSGKDGKGHSFYHEAESLKYTDQIEAHPHEETMDTMEDHLHKHSDINEGEGLIDYQGRVTDKRTKRFWNLQRPKKIE